MYSQIAANKRRTVLLIVVFLLFISAIAYGFAWYFSDQSIVVYAMVFAVLYSAISYWGSAKIALGLSGAKPISKKDAPGLYRTVENLSITAGLPMPQVYIIEDPAPNAFATGRDPKHSYVAVTRGLLDIMNDTELEGVLAHELSHVRNYDIRVMAVVAALVSVVAILSDMFLRISFFGGDDDNNGGNIGTIVAIVVAILTPLIAAMIQLAVSRKREYLADASGAELTRYPEGLASALQKIEASGTSMRKVSSATSHLFIASPLRGKGRNFVSGLLSTHPPIEDRIKKLEYMERHA